MQATYFGTSALLKPVVVEAESDALRKFAPDTAAQVTSVVAGVEIARAVMGCGAAIVSLARRVMDAVEWLDMTPRVLELASSIGDQRLRTPDSIHLASAAPLLHAIRAAPA